MEGMYKVRAGIMWILGIVIICLLIMMTVIGTYQIITRYFFNRPSTVSGGLLTYFFTWTALFASAYVLGRRDHMHMGSLIDKITGPAKKYLETIVDLPTLTSASAVTMYGGTSIVKLIMIQTTASLRVSMGYIYVTVPVTGLLIMLFSLMNTADMMHRGSSGKEEA